MNLVECNTHNTLLNDRNALVIFLGNNFIIKCELISKSIMNRGHLDILRMVHILLMVHIKIHPLMAPVKHGQKVQLVKPFTKKALYYNDNYTPMIN